MQGSTVAPFILRADGHMHASDVRSVAFGYAPQRLPIVAADDHHSGAPLTSGTPAEDRHVFDREEDVVIITSSRDNTATLSRIPVKPAVMGEDNMAPDGGDDIVAERQFIGHEAFVNFSLLHREGLAFLRRPDGAAAATAVDREEGAEAATPFLITGSNDSHVLVWNLEPTRLEAVLDGHRSGVTCGDVIRTRQSSAPPTKPPLGQADRAAGLCGEAEGYHGDLVTGDWAGTILVFSHETGKVRAAYNRHENAIRGLVHLPGTSLIASASGDKSVHCWDFVRLAQEQQNSLALSGTVSRVLLGHEDVVQCICYVGSHTRTLSPSSFYSYIATGSNDCTVRIWAVENSLKDAHSVVVLRGHDSLVYGVCFHASTGELMSASEDRTVRVWGRQAPAAKADEETAEAEGGALVGSIRDDGFFAGFATVHIVPHPCVVWSVAACRVRRERHGNEEAETQGGDAAGACEDLLLTGGADSTVRLWTRHDEHFASVEKLEMLEEAIAAQKVDIKLVDGAGGAGASSLFDMQNMPSVEQLHLHKGKAEGEKKFFKNETNEIEVYVWASGRWDKIGVVVSGNEPVSVSSTGQVINAATGGAAAGGAKKREKRMCKGKFYDYVFDVDINGTMLQLPYNAGDSVFEAAQNFINEHSVLAQFSEQASVAASATAGGGGGVSQEHKEQIVNFIMDNIDRADVQRIPGLGGSSSAAGEPAPSQGGDASALLQEDSMWPTAELVESFSADGAQRKATELLSHNAPDKAAAFAHVMQDLQHLLGSPASPCPPSAASAMARTLADLFAALPADKKFPAIDAVRFAVGQCPQHAVAFLLALKPHLTTPSPSASGAAFRYAPSTDADALVLVRLVSNLLPALMTAQADTAAAAGFTQDVLVWALTSVLPTIASVNASTSASIRQALVNFYLRNLSVLLRVVLSSGNCAGAEGRHAFAAFTANTSSTEADDAAVAAAKVRAALMSGFTAALAPLLASDTGAHVSLLLRSAAVAGVELSAAPTGAEAAGATAAFKAQLKQALMAVPAGQDLANALKL